MPTPTLKFAKAKTSEDFKKITKFLKQLWPKKKLNYEKFFNKHKNKNFYLINHNKKTIGFYSLRSLDSNTRLYLDELVVDTRLRGKGCGTKTIRHIISKAKKDKFKTIQLHSNWRRKKAHHFYEDLGFQKSISLMSILRRAFIFTRII